ncbi:peptide chain release factor H [Bartonella sp. HY329]|uniref:peptide chain release factor H n=1 Tax=unclassified Bartonella TaxID=2645622 RepID=UPI0021C76AF2|nr:MULTISPECIES: peptide chain release factor H [unclassified Bartonella]UXM93913.1 peptide chain release factor H [Bartonella sp. HY329]UXN08234.1 peptide chain release factor H [Bartonella sp. HY328]
MSSATLFVTSGMGPAECRMALSFFLQKIELEAKEKSLNIEITVNQKGQKNGPASAIIVLYGDEANNLAKSVTGSICFSFTSPRRPNHKRKNWFIGVNRIDDLMLEPDIAINQCDIRFETLRAGGPGGQHQNTTDSAVRVIHLPTGFMTVAREERSQHRNKAIAVKRLATMLALLKNDAEESRKQKMFLQHRQLERGNPIRHYKMEN